VLLPRTLSTERNSVASPVEPRTSSVAPSAIIAAVMNTTLLPQSRKLKRNNHPTITDHKLPIRERLLSYTVPPPLLTVPVLRRMVHSWAPEPTGETVRCRPPTWHLLKKVLIWTRVPVTKTRNIRICNQLLLVIPIDLPITKMPAPRLLLPLTLTGRPKLDMLDLLTRAQVK